MATEPIDNLPLIPDKVVDRLRKGQDVSLEEISPAAAELSHERQAAKSQPLRMEGLSPISKPEAARRRTQTGSSLPAMPATRRVLPAPYRRESIGLTGHGKTWGYVRADEVLAEDIIPDFGRVTSVVTEIRYSTPSSLGIADMGGLVATGTDIVLTSQGGAVQVLDAGAQVRVFRQHSPS